MDSGLVYFAALAEARSCLAALADSAVVVEESCFYERLLIALDEIHPFGPAIYTITGPNETLLLPLSLALLVLLRAAR